MKNYACIYLRLSRKDGDIIESNSISNQRQIIKAYAKENNFEIICEYIDELAIIRLNLINLELSRGLIKSYFFIF